MTRCLNDADIAESDNYLLSQGYDLSPAKLLWLDARGTETRPLRNGGMINPARHKLPPGTVLYRFADSRGSMDAVTSGGWWLERKEFEQLIRFAEVNSIPLGYAVRILCCVPPEWGSQLDYLVRVRTRDWLTVYRGLAADASAKDKLTRTEITARNDIAAWRLHQIFVPGLRNPRTGTATGNNKRFFTLDGEWAIKNRFTWIFL